MAYLIDSLINHDTKFSQEGVQPAQGGDKSGHYTFGLSEGAYLGVILSAGFIFGSVIYRLFVLSQLLIYSKKIISAGFKAKSIGYALFALVGTEMFETLTLNISIVDMNLSQAEPESPEQKYAKPVLEYSDLNEKVKGMNAAINRIQWDDITKLQVDFNQKIDMDNNDFKAYLEKSKSLFLNDLSKQ